jgi:hypothetical protein
MILAQNAGHFAGFQTKMLHFVDRVRLLTIA